MSYKQGQTVYIIDMGYQYNPPRPSVVQYFLYSRKQELPPECCIIEKMPVDHLNKLVAKGLIVTSSKRKAKQKLSKLINSIKRKL